MMPRHELADACEHRASLAGIPEGEIPGQQRFFELRRNRGMLEQRLHLACEGEEPAVPIVVERLLAEPVARDEEAARVLVPEREGEHAAKTLHAIGAVLLVRMDDRLAVRPGLISMAGGFHARTQRGVIKNLAIVDQPEIAFFIRHRLMPARHVDDCEPAESEIGPRVAIVAEIVWPAMPDRIGHALKDAHR